MPELAKENGNVFVVCPECGVQNKIVKSDLGLLIECLQCKYKIDLTNKDLEKSFEKLLR